MNCGHCGAACPTMITCGTLGTQATQTVQTCQGNACVMSTTLCNIQYGCHAGHGCYTSCTVGNHDCNEDC